MHGGADVSGSVAGCGLETVVDLAAVGDGDHEDDEGVVMHLVDDPVVADAEPTQPGVPGEWKPCRRSRPRVVFEGGECGDDAAGGGLVELA